MTASATFRPLAAFLLAASVFLALPGCGGDKPQPPGKGDDKGKKEDPKLNIGQPTDPKTTIPPVTIPAQPAKVDTTTGVGKEAVDFLMAVRAGSARADQLSAAFVKAIGLPVVLDSDKAKGYSTGAAEDWMRKVGASTGFGPPLKADQVGDVALFRGILVGKSGGYSLRMVKEGGAWKVDWLSASSVDVKKAIAVPANSSDAILQEFAATAVVESILDQDAMPAPQRHAIVAAGLTPALRMSWASPLDGDKASGYDYSLSKLKFKVDDIGGKAESVSYTQQGEGAYVAEVAKAGGGKAAYLVKLVKGQPLVESLMPQ
jgi:hypothetical protein